MQSGVQSSEGRSAPALRYRDMEAAVDWLSDAFGFELRRVRRDAHARVCYAELSFGETVVMLGAVSGFEIDKLMRQPDEIGGAETQSCYYFVRDVEAHYARACAEGAEIVLALKTQADGQRGFTCRDPEGHLWTFGTYDLWHGRRADARAPLEVNTLRPWTFGSAGPGVPCGVFWQ